MAGILVRGSMIYEYERAVKGTSFIRLYNEKDFCFKQFSNISKAGFTTFNIYKRSEDFEINPNKKYFIYTGSSFIPTTELVEELFEEDQFEIAPVEGIGSVTAKCGVMLEGQILCLDLPAGIYAQKGLHITFKTSHGNKEVYGVQIEGIIYKLVDSDGNSTQNYAKGFDPDDIIVIILDMENKTALVNGFNGTDVINEVKEGSESLVTSGAVYNYVNSTIIQDVFNEYVLNNADAEVTSGSTNLVISGGVAKAINNLDDKKSDKGHVHNYAGSKTVGGIADSSYAVALNSDSDIEEDDYNVAIIGTDGVIRRGNKTSGEIGTCLSTISISATDSLWETVDDGFQYTLKIGTARVLAVYETISGGVEQVYPDRIIISSGGGLTIKSSVKFDGYLILSSVDPFEQATLAEVEEIISRSVNEVSSSLGTITFTAANWVASGNNTYTLTADIGTAKIINICKGSIDNGYNIIDVNNAEVTSTGQLILTHNMAFEGFVNISSSEPFGDTTVDEVNAVIENKVKIAVSEEVANYYATTISNELNNKANVGNVYTISQIDAKLNDILARLSALENA